MVQEFVKVPVPVDRLQEVFALLAASRVAGERSVTVGRGAVPTAETDVASIDVERIARAYRESSDAMKKALDHMADHAGHVIRMEELAGSVGYSAAQMRGTLGSFGNRWRNRYQGGEDVPLPFSRWWVSADNTMAYQMSGDVAAVMRAARGA